MLGMATKETQGKTCHDYPLGSDPSALCDRRWCAAECKSEHPNGIGTCVTFKSCECAFNCSV